MMNFLLYSLVVAVVTLQLAQAYIIPPGFGVTGACLGRPPCAPGFVCVEHPNNGPHCSQQQPCPNFARCERRPAVQPLAIEEQVKQEQHIPVLTGPFAEAKRNGCMWDWECNGSNQFCCGGDCCGL